MGTQRPLPTKGVEALPQFSAHFFCGQKAGCIKMSLGMKVGLSLGDFVLDEDPAPLPKKEAEPPIFGPCLLWPNGWMDQDGTWRKNRPQPKQSLSPGDCVRWGLSPPSQKGGGAPNFRPMSIVAKCLDG